MRPSGTTSRQARRIHRWLVPIAAAPLLITAGTGSLYSLLLEQNIDAFWLLKLHTGQSVSYTHLTLPTILLV